MVAFVDLLVKAEKNRWCVQPFCTTCGARDFRGGLAKIPSLENDLMNTAPAALLRAPSWSDALRIAAYDFRLMDWDSILQAWLPDASNNEVFLDHVLFYLITKVPCTAETRTDWIDVCVSKALIRKRNSSLVESLIRVLGESAKEYSGLVETALDLSPFNPRLHQALVKNGYLRREDEFAREVRENKMRQRATQNLPAAIRRKDIKAIEAMLRWKPVIFEQVETGYTIADLAKSSTDKRVRDIFETYCAAQQP